MRNLEDASNLEEAEKDAKILAEDFTFIRAQLADALAASVNMKSARTRSEAAQANLTSIQALDRARSRLVLADDRVRRCQFTVHEHLGKFAKGVGDAKGS